MTLARWQASIVDQEGNVLPGAQVTVRRETAGAPLVVLYSDRDGTAILGNPFPADADGFAAFHVAGGAYRIDVTSGAFSRTHRYVGVGLQQESDAVLLDISYLFSATTTDADPGAGVFRVNNASLASVTEIYFDQLDDVGADLSAWFSRIDDGGISTDRGVLVIRALDGTAEFVGRVTGNITDGSGYFKVSVAALAAAGTFAEGARVGVSFMARGVNGEIIGPGAITQAGQLAVFADSTGTALRGGTVDEGSPTDPVFIGSASEARAATPGHVLEAGVLRSAAVAVALSDAAVVAVDWSTAINFSLTVTANRQIGNPINGIPGTWRTILVQGNDATDRTITFGNLFLGEVPAITDCDSGRWYLLTVYCVSASHFVVSSKKANGT